MWLMMGHMSHNASYPSHFGLSRFLTTWHFFQGNLTFCIIGLYEFSNPISANTSFWSWYISFEHLQHWTIFKLETGQQADWWFDERKPDRSIQSTTEPSTHRSTTMQQAKSLATGCHSLSDFVLLFCLFWFWSGERRGIEADHLLRCISIEPLLMDEQDDGKQKCKRRQKAFTSSAFYHQSYNMNIE